MDELELLDWRRRIADLYAEVRAAPAGAATWSAWRSGRDALLRSHPQTPVAPDDRAAFVAAAFFDYDPALRFEVEITPVEPVHLGGEVPMASVGRLEVLGATLTAFWLDGYAGGLFVPFRDATNGTATYGGGRYLLDTAKGADLGSSGLRLVLDFNYAYHPSCAFDDRWVCPLAGRDNVIPRPVTAGELLPRRGATSASTT